ncbi:MAG: hypothetical protein DHS20C18_18360 [Saprospiraceae bacterium]|nr:MAG: hypothetical protein DHS20C18_18360 [Saprospiraceae bacterium]
MIRNLFSLATQAMTGFFTGLFMVVSVVAGLFFYQNYWEEWKDLPIVAGLTDTYLEGLNTLEYLGGEGLQHFYQMNMAQDTRLEIRSNQTYPPGKYINQLPTDHPIVIQSSWEAADILKKLKDKGFSKGKLRAAKKFTDYIEAHKSMALYEMLESKILASTKLAQAILESQAGNSKLARATKNQFGIKALPSKRARKKIKRKAFDELSNDEFIHRAPAVSSYNFHDDHRYDRFEVYRSVSDSYSRHTQLLSQPCKMGKKGCYEWIWKEFPVGTYCDISKAAKLYQPSSHIAPEDFFDGNTKIPYYAACAAGLKMAGYATSPTYHKKIAYIIDTYELWRFDVDLINSVMK